MKTTLELTYKGLDRFSRPVYENTGRLYVDVDPRKGRNPIIYTKYCDQLEGEPDMLVNSLWEFKFVPKRVVW